MAFDVDTVGEDLVALTDVVGGLAFGVDVSGGIFATWHHLVVVQDRPARATSEKQGDWAATRPFELAACAWLVLRRRSSYCSRPTWSS